MQSIEFGTVYIPEEKQSLKNSKAVIEAVQKLFPEWASQAQPYINVLTFQQWLKRGYSVKKGEKSIRISIMSEVEEDDKKTKRLVRRTACLFALPQVERKS